MGSIFSLNCARECAPCGGYTGYADGFGKKSFSFWVETFSSIKENGFSALLSNL